MAPAFCLRWQAQRGAGTGKPVEGDLGAAGTPDAGVKGFKEGQVIPYAEYRRAYGRRGGQGDAQPADGREQTADRGSQGKDRSQRGCPFGDPKGDTDLQ